MIRRALLALVLLAPACGDDAAPSSDPLPDGVHFGFVTALEPAQRRLVFDDAELLEGDDAASAAEDDGSATTPGGRYVRNPTVDEHPLALSEDIVVRLVADGCCDLAEVRFEDWFDGFEPGARRFYGTASSHYELTIEGARVVLVEEVVVD